MLFNPVAAKYMWLLRYKFKLIKIKINEKSSSSVMLATFQVLCSHL